MIYLSIRGRLGNQMFQYAFARALCKQLNQDIIIDWHYVIDSDKRDPKTGFEDSLKNFNVYPYKSIENCSYKEYMSLRQYIALRNYEKAFPYNGTIIQKQEYQEEFYVKHKKLGLLWYENGYLEFDLKKLPKNIFLSGYFESTKYFNCIEDELKKEFKPKEMKLEHNQILYNEIENSESVCVTVRRGDFVNSKLHSVCTTEYFLKGMDLIKEKVPNAKFFIFSNEVEWIRKNVKFKYPVTFENGSDLVWEKLRLMYSCKHFVISNSTFSWWAQYLSSNKNKIVVAPDRWLNDDFESELLSDDNFIKIKC